MATMFNRLTRRPAPGAVKRLPPPVGKVLNRIPTKAKPITASIPAATMATVATPPKLVPSKPSALSNTLQRAFKPKPEQPTTSTPDALVHRAIANVFATRRQPDRGAFILRQGVALPMADGSAGGSPVTPLPIRSALSPVFQRVIATGGNPQIRQTQVNTLARESYLDRQRLRDRFASIGIISRRGSIQRHGMSYILKSLPSRYGALEKAQMHRIKDGTPTGVVGDRAIQTPQSHVGSVYAKLVAPTVTNEAHIAQRIGGSATAAAPVPVAVATVPPSTMSTSESVGKSYAWAPPDTTAASKATTTSPLIQSAERWGLLIAVGVIAFILLKK